MTRAEIIELVTERTQEQGKVVDNIVRTFLDVVTENLAAGEKVTISGFGTFERKRRKATVARNPQTGEPMKVEAQNVAVFRAGSGLKDAVRAEEEQQPKAAIY